MLSLCYSSSFNSNEKTTVYTQKKNAHTTDLALYLRAISLLQWKTNVEDTQLLCSCNHIAMDYNCILTSVIVFLAMQCIHT